MSPAEAAVFLSLVFCPEDGGRCQQYSVAGPSAEFHDYESCMHGAAAAAADFLESQEPGKWHWAGTKCQRKAEKRPGEPMPGTMGLELHEL